MAKHTHATQSNIRNLDDQTMLVSFMIERFGWGRSLRNEDYDVHADDTDTSANDRVKRDVTAVRKRFVDFPELDAVNEHLNETRRLFRMRTLPSYLREGVYRIHISAVDGIVEMLEERARELATLLDAFIAAYPDAVERMRDRHKALFNPANYPPAESAASEYRIVYRFMASGVPEALAKINDAVYRQQQEQYTALLHETEQKYALMMREAVADLVGHMADRLAPNADGTRKRLSRSLMTNFREFVDTFPLRNVVNDTDLANLVSRLDGIFAGVADISMLKDDDDLRAELARQTATIKDAADKLVITEAGGRRKLTL